MGGRRGRERAKEPEMEAGEGVGVLIALKRSGLFFSLFAFVIMERRSAPCLLLIHELNYKSSAASPEFKVERTAATSETLINRPTHKRCN